MKSAISNDVDRNKKHIYFKAIFPPHAFIKFIKLYPHIE